MAKNHLKKTSFFNAFEHAVLNNLKKLSLAKTPLYVGVSGGADSVALLMTLVRLKKILKLDFSVIHVHHGKGSIKQLRYRNKAWNFVKKLCEKNQVPFYSNLESIKKNKLVYKREPVQNLKSEEEFRNFRQDVFKDFMVGNSFLVLAHTKNDLLETQILRLIRGAGFLGLKAMSIKDGNKIRPLVNRTRLEVMEYLKQQGLGYVSDPSNRDLAFMRNWVRHKWLPQLERKTPGSVNSLARSFEVLLAASKAQDLSRLIRDNTLDLKIYWSLSVEEKQQLIALYFNQLKIRNYTYGHVQEFLKRLDNSQRVYTFKLLKFDWTVNAEQVRLV